ncbi:DUF6415 family natural product biosynthesis protein [Streptomyces sp. NP-1717]|uniref:DUF6415 family natural product biosynthesis protein n=1 Tax=Streptomyces sp. NP-1717 TaxID=2704470 RepID=UPI001F5DD6E7|nr:DUF6415 family natural product biosynthesis protein [Streptomyces sp. NP-1717]MCI3223340.1 hypothetical protein [Streptomyces sp. NP-1717]
MTPDRRTPGAHWPHQAPRFTHDPDTLRRLLDALNRDHPIDFATISRTVTEALGAQLPPERAWVDITTLKLRGHLQLLLTEYDGDTAVPATLALHRDAYRLLALCDTFDADTPPLHAYELMRALAGTTRSFADLHAAGERDR